MGKRCESRNRRERDREIFDLYRISRSYFSLDIHLPGLEVVYDANDGLTLHYIIYSSILSIIDSRMQTRNLVILFDSGIRRELIK